MEGFPISNTEYLQRLCCMLFPLPEKTFEKAQFESSVLKTIDTGKNNMIAENIWKLDVNLQKLSAISIALHFWELPNAKDDIRGFWKKHYPDEKIRKKWNFYVVGSVEERVDNLKIPELLLDDIKCYLYTMGGLIFDFIQHTTKNGFGLDFGLKICWASYGQIDEVKMVRECLKGTSEKLTLEDRFLSLARIYNEEDLVSLGLMKLEEEKKFSAEDMLDHCLRNEDLLFAAKYYWYKLNDAQKAAEARKKSYQCLMFFPTEVKNMYIQRMRGELLVFFMAEMLPMERLKFIAEFSNSLFNAFLDVWPYQEFCLTILEYFRLRYPIDLVIQRIDSKSVIKYINKNIYHAILQKMLKKTPLKTKKKYFKDNLGTGKDDFLYHFHKKCDYKTLSIILNDPSTEEYKGKVMDDFLWMFKNQIRMEDLDFTINYIRYVLDEEERKLFKQKLNWVDEFVCKEQDFYVADLLLDFLFDTETERMQEKKKVRGVEVCKFVKEGKFGAADEFVKWRFKTDEERKKIKEAIFLIDDVEPEVQCADLIRSGNVKEVDNYLIWRFESEEEQKEVKDSVLREMDSVEVCGRLIKDRNYKAALEYLNWRYESKEERDNTKKAVLKLLGMDPVEHCNLLIKEDDYFEAEGFLLWLHDTEEERKNVKKAVYALETMDPKEFVERLIRVEDSLVYPYLNWRYPSDEERINFKKTLYVSDERLRNQCYDILFNRDVRESRFESMNNKCTAKLTFFLETKEAVYEFRKLKLFDKDLFLEKLKHFPRRFCDNFLQYCSRSTEEKDIAALYTKAFGGDLFLSLFA